MPVADDYGKPRHEECDCLHEEDYGILWKHYEFRTKRSRCGGPSLVISFFTTVGNYDYGFFWYFYQDGTIQLEVKLTGIIQTAAIAAGKSYPWGGMVAENLGGPTHQHFFNARLHMMLDGEGNTVTEHEFRPRPWGTDNPYGNVFDTTTCAPRERDAVRETMAGPDATGRSPIPIRRTASGPRRTSCAPSAPVMLAQEGCYMTRAAVLYRTSG
jgi:primary-amine oxidase